MKKEKFKKFLKTFILVLIIGFVIAGAICSANQIRAPTAPYVTITQKNVRALQKFN